MGSGRRLRAAPLLVVAVVVAAVVRPGVASANLYSRRAGFGGAKLSAEAPSPAPVRIWKPAGWRIRLSAAVRAWNEQAGRELFRRVRSADRADVVLLDGTGIGWAAACYDADGAYDMQAAYARCSIFVPFTGATRSSRWSLIHEMGHTLGFADHVPASEYRRYVRWNLDPRVCDDPSHPAYSRYDGIMSDCRASDRFAGDAAALIRAGYAESALSA